jgi:hypothetical protein
MFFTSYFQYCFGIWVPKIAGQTHVEEDCGNAVAFVPVGVFLAALQKMSIINWLFNRKIHSERTYPGKVKVRVIVASDAIVLNLEIC